MVPSTWVDSNDPLRSELLLLLAVVLGAPTMIAMLLLGESQPSGTGQDIVSWHSWENGIEGTSLFLSPSVMLDLLLLLPKHLLSRSRSFLFFFFGSIGDKGRLSCCLCGSAITTTLQELADKVREKRITFVETTTETTSSSSTDHHSIAKKTRD